MNEIAAGVEAHLSEFSEFLRVKASQNVILGSVFKDINGLVHFIHVNRGNGRVITPTIDVTKKRGAFIKKQVRNRKRCNNNNLRLLMSEEPQHMPLSFPPEQRKEPIVTALFSYLIHIH